MNFSIKRPYITAAIIIFVVLAIVYIEYNKPDIPSPVNEDSGEYAPDFTGIEKWINSEPLSINELKGNVVLVDFWTYTCINCIRTLPYLKMWDEKYRDNGLIIVGVHTPEFNFEKEYENVLSAVNKYGIKYPVAQDNDYATWNAYQNRYWPHKFLIDINGKIRYDHIGEGSYEETEKMIQLLLEERNKEKVDGITKPSEAVSAGEVGTPEIYFGYNFIRGNFGNSEGINPEEIVSYKLPEEVAVNTVYLDGNWKNNKDDMELTSDKGTVLLVFKAKVVNIVAGSEEGSDIAVYLNEEKISGENKGSDVINGAAKITESRLYNLINKKDYEPGIIRIDVSGKGFRIYTFTFG